MGSDIDEDTSSDEAISDTSVVKIMSDDPMAAARAAAILKMVSFEYRLLMNTKLSCQQRPVRL